MEEYLDYFELPYTDFNPNIECPLVMKNGVMVRQKKPGFRVGSAAENRTYVAGLAYLLTVSAIAHDGKLCMAYGGDLEYALLHLTQDQVLDNSLVNSRRWVGSSAQRALYPFFQQSNAVTPSNGYKQTALMKQKGVVYRIQIQDSHGALQYTTFFGICEHTEATKAGGTDTDEYRKMMALHHGHCLDVVSSKKGYDRTAIIRPSSFVGVKKLADGSDAFPDPFPINSLIGWAWVQYQTLITQLEELRLVWFKHYRPPANEGIPGYEGIQDAFYARNGRHTFVPPQPRYKV